MCVCGRPGRWFVNSQVHITLVGVAIVYHLLAALCYGSQHLRFRWEWLLCTANGLALCYLSVHYEGSMLATLTAAVCFAVFRHWMRTGLDARRAHKQ